MAAPDPADLKAMFGLKPAEAIAYLKQKGYRIGWNWQDTLDDAHARAFTVAKVTRIDLLQDIRKSLLAAQEQGETLETWAKKLTPTLQAKGWWGKQVIVDSVGNAQMVQLGSPRRLRTIYQTNLQSAYMAGRYKQMLESVDSHPLWRYVAVLDGRTRPNHRAMNGRVYRYDDPIWSSIYPPNGFGCRCRVSPMTESKAAQQKLTVESSDGQRKTISEKIGEDRNGQPITTQRTGVSVQGADGKSVFFAPDAGFNSSPVSSHLMDEFLLQKATNLMGQAKAMQAVQDVIVSPPRLKTWEAFVSNAEEFGRTQGQTVSVGVMTVTDSAFVATKGAQPTSSIVTLEDRLLVGKKAVRHQQAQNALTAVELATVPVGMANPQYVLWDTRNVTLLYMLATDNPQELIKIAVRPRADVAEVVSIFKVSLKAIQDGIGSGEYDLVR